MPPPPLVCCYQHRNRSKDFLKKSLFPLTIICIFRRIRGFYNSGEKRTLKAILFMSSATTNQYPLNQKWKVKHYLGTELRNLDAVPSVVSKGVKWERKKLRPCILQVSQRTKVSDIWTIHWPSESSRQHCTGTPTTCLYLQVAYNGYNCWSYKIFCFSGLN